VISFVIPTLNEERTLEATLRSLAQYSGEHEVIVSDGGSTDRTLEIAEQYADKVVRHAGPRRQTIAEGRNQGALLAAGDFIVEMDADTRFPNIDRFFSTILGAFDDPTVVAATAWFRVYPEDETLADRAIFWTMGAASLVLDNCLGSSCTCGGEFQMIRTEAFRRVGGYDNDLVAMEDVELFRRLRRLGRIHFQKDLFIYHSGRRAHILGWPRSIATFVVNSLYFAVFRKTRSKAWEPVR